jgi:hypothetical protein
MEIQQEIFKHKNFMKNWNLTKKLWFSLNDKKYCHFNRTECQYGFHEHISGKLVGAMKNDTHLLLGGCRSGRNIRIFQCGIT